MKMTKKPGFGALSLAAALAVGAGLIPGAAQADATGNIGVVSKYVLRGITSSTENSGAAVQGGFDYSHSSGVYAGYWGSSLGYPGADSNPTTDAEFENDFYGGWAGDVGPVSLSAGVVYYYYMDTSDANGAEATASVGWQGLELHMNYLLQDVTWGNQGDTYLTLSYSHDLPAKFSASATLGYYLYTDKGDFIASTKEDSAFRHLNLSLSHPVGDTGADMSVTYVVGGKDRQGNDQQDTVVLGLSYGFNI